MKLKKSEFCKYVEDYRLMLEQEDKVLEILNCDPEAIMCQWISKYYSLLSDMCELPENPLYGSDLDWFCYETNFGQREDLRKVFFEGRTWDIKDAGILYDFIMEQEK